MTATADNLGQARYALVTTFRRDGQAVPTPVWVVRDGDALAIWTVTASGKVKRIRRDPRVMVAPCDMRGRSTGAAVAARASVLDAKGTERVRDLVRAKYGLSGRLTVFFSLLRRGREGTVGVRIVLTGED